MGTAIVAKKKTAPAKQEGERRPIAVTIKGSEEWKAWLERGAKFSRLSVSGLVEHAVLDYLKRKGFTEESPER